MLNVITPEKLRRELPGATMLPFIKPNFSHTCLRMPNRLQEMAGEINFLQMSRNESDFLSMLNS